MGVGGGGKGWGHHRGIMERENRNKQFPVKGACSVQGHTV